MLDIFDRGHSVYELGKQKRSFPPIFCWPKATLNISKVFLSFFSSLEQNFIDTLFCPVCLFVWTQAWQMEQHTLVLNYILFNNHTSFSVIRSRIWLEVSPITLIAQRAILEERLDISFTLFMLSVVDRIVPIQKDAWFFCICVVMGINFPQKVF